MRKLLCFLLVLACYPRLALAEEPPSKSVKTAIEKGLKRIQTGAASYPEHRQCFSCHHQAMAILTMKSAQRRGLAIDEQLLKSQLAYSLKTFRNKQLIAKGQGVGGDSTSVVYILHTLAAAEQPRDATTDALVEYLLVRQRKDGSWPVAAQRPPTMGSLFTNAGLAMAVLKQYGPTKTDAESNKLRERVKTAIGNGQAWLLKTKPVTTEDKVFQLRGLVDSEADAKEIEKARELLLKEQRADGSWAQLAEQKEGDAYATGSVLVTLRRAGLDANHAVYRKGVQYLVDTQTAEGAWIVTTRARPLQRFFDNGDPGGKSQFISFAATGWALLALLETVPTADKAFKAP